MRTLGFDDLTILAHPVVPLTFFTVFVGAFIQYHSYCPRYDGCSVAPNTDPAAATAELMPATLLEASHQGREANLGKWPAWDDNVMKVAS